MEKTFNNEPFIFNHLFWALSDRKLGNFFQRFVRQRGIE